MHHLAIMRKSWGLTEKILRGEKTIESRWYLHKHIPWGKIQADDTIFFKNSGEPVTIRARVEQVLSFSELTPAKVKAILERYGNADGIEPEKLPQFYQLFKHKQYCLLIFLKNVRAISPFAVDKSGFGMMSAWITVENIDSLRRRTDN